MTPAEYQRISEIVGHALDLSGEERRRYLGAVCQGDPELRREVDSLLWHGSQAAPFLDEPLVRPREPERIGPYRLLERIADGGMGTVYRVRRQDDFELDAALKLVRLDRRSREFVDRFHRERQILARLDHPAIARILDGGTTAFGTPYFVMELVTGQPIDAYCDARRLPIRERLELFLEVCGAVRFAHRNHILHRDLKPGHILVNRDGRPKLIDFGIAQPLPEADDEPRRAAQASGMTVRYASPEQVSGQAMTPKSDVYSLGMVLYELLTGTAPYDLDATSLSARRRQVATLEPRAPSAAFSGPNRAARLACRARRTSLRKLRRTLRGDLDSILLRTFRKRPDERYASVEEFAEDLQRFLDGRPVLTRRGTWAYRTGKLLRRRALPLTAPGALLLITVASAAILLLSRQTALRPGDAEWFGSVLGSVFAAADPNETQVPARLEILDRAREAISRLRPEDPPAYRAGLWQELGRAYLRLGSYEKARPAFEEALALRRAAEDPAHPSIAESLHDLAHVLDKLGDPAARPLTLEAVSIQRRNADRHPLELARGLTILGRQYYDDGLYREGQAALLESLAIKRGLPGTTDRDIVVTLSNLAATWRKLERYEKAVTTYREVLAIRRRSLGSFHTDVARSLSSLATILRDLGRHDEAMDLLEEAIAIRQRLLGHDHPDTARVHRTLATVRHARGDLAGAAGSYAQALRLLRISFPDTHPEIAVTRTRQAALAADVGESGRCRTLAGQAIAALELSEHPTSGRLTAAREVLARCSKAPLGEADAGVSVTNPRF